MADLRHIRLLGDPLLYETALPVTEDELPHLLPQINLLHDLVKAFRARYGKGRAIAAPQIGLLRRIICYHVGDDRRTLINPVLTDLSDEMITLWDDCMSFPDLLVRVQRHRQCTIEYLDLDWQPQRWELSDDLSELMQHEYDHLDGILATMRAIDSQSFKMINS